MYQPLTSAAVTAALGAQALPRTLRCHASIGSTMDLARELLQQLPADQLPALVLADEQTAGRGRQGRPWVAPPGTALLSSLALRPTWLRPAQGVALVWMLAVALCEAVEELTPLRPGLKWPNDLLVQMAEGSEHVSSDPAAEQPHDPPGPPLAAVSARPALYQPTWAKTAGILLEVNLSAERVEWAILGCGVNVSAAPPPGSTPYPATSLHAAGGPVSRLDLVSLLMRRVGYWHTRLRAGDQDALFAAWRTRLITLGQAVRINTADGPFEGFAEDVAPDGSLYVRDATGVLRTITTGDVGLVQT
jgi:BirA family transcriptional regulator, biotin operon repressor / biotin---[acetyl-CoA-carboxylase] ligase